MYRDLEGARALKAAQRIVDAALARANRKKLPSLSRLEEIQLHTAGYAEPGYSDPSNGVLCLGNWNSISKWDEKTRHSVDIDKLPCLVSHLLEKIGCEIEWSDEWDACGQCGKMVRTEPNSYGWQRSFVDFEDGYRICVECLTKEKHWAEEHFENLEGNCSSCNTVSELDPADYGYIKFEQDFEHGLYGGQSADPKKIGAALEKRGIERYIFNLDSVGQFDQDFSVWVHEEEKDKMPLSLSDSEVDGVDPAEVLKAGLKSAPIAMASVPPGEGPVVTTLHGDGTATARRVSPQDFIEGKALDA